MNDCHPYNGPLITWIIQHPDRQVSVEEAQALANEWGCAFCECSSKHNMNIQLVRERFRLSRILAKLTVLYICYVGV